MVAKTILAVLVSALCAGSAHAQLFGQPRVIPTLSVGNLTVTGSCTGCGGGGSAWGGITGTLADQLDLAAALGGKEATGVAAAAITAHEGAANPHPTYLTQAEADALYAGLSHGLHVTDGDKGDITIGTSATTFNVDNAAITLAKMANLAQDQFIGRTTASTGVPETATITAAARTVLDDISVGAMLTTLGGQSLDATLTALAGLNATAGVVEQTGADAFTKRAFGVAASTDVLTRADGDGRFGPIAVDYLVGTANASLTGEIAVGTSPGGELGGTWASPTLDDSLTVTGWDLGASAATTAAGNDSDTSLATTAFVQAEIDDGDLITDNCVLEADATPIPDSCVGDGTDGGGGGAPTDADYLVGTTNGSLSAEIVVGTSPGGELGGTWASPTLDDGITIDSWVLGSATTGSTAAANDSDTSLATTAYVQAELDDVDLLSDNCVLENDATPIPDSCVGDGSDAGAGGGISYADVVAASLAGF